MITKLKPIIVIWEDCWTQAGWSCPHEAMDMKPMLVTEVGFCLKKTKNALYVASGINEEDGLMSSTRIPLGCVKKIIYLKTK